MGGVQLAELVHDRRRQVAGLGIGQRVRPGLTPAGDLQKLPEEAVVHGVEDFSGDAKTRRLGFILLTGSQRSEGGHEQTAEEKSHG